MIYIANRLSVADYKKAEEFLKRIKPLLATNDCQFKKSFKNTAFDRQFNLQNEQKIEIIKSLTAYDCIKIAPNDNPRYSESEVYQFIKCIDLLVYGENETRKLYIKMYLAEQPSFDIVIVISFHEEGEYD